MNRFHNVLFYAQDGQVDRTALDRVIQLARNNEARLRLVTTVEELPWYAGALGIAKNIIETNLAREKKEWLETLATPAREQGLRVETSTFHGEVFLGVIREVLRQKHDLVVKGTNPSLGSSLDTTDLHLLRKCPCPVWLIKPHDENKQFRRILAAVDPLAQETPSSRLNQTILQLASSMAKREGGELYVTHVWQAHGETIMEMVKAYSAQVQINGYVDNIKNRASEALKKLMDSVSLSLPEENVILRRGNPGAVIPETVNAKKIDLLVMGTITKSDVPGFLIGRTAETILQRVDCSILAVKPNGFVSPVLAN